MSKLDEEQVLKRNRHVDPKRVAAFEAFYRAAEQAGIEVAPRYRIAAPLGVLAGQPRQKRLASEAGRKKS